MNRFRIHSPIDVFTAVVFLGATSGDVSSRPAAAQEPTHQTFVGVVVDGLTGDPVIGAFATALGTDRFASTDHNGSFRVDGLLPGRYTFRIWRLGYTPTMFSAALDSGVVHVLDAPIVLEPIPIQMPELVVEAERTRMVAGPLRDFYRRRREGRGWFFTSEQIDERRADQLPEILRMAPGADVQYLGGFQWAVRLVPDQRIVCPVVYFVDGIQTNERMALSIRPERLEAIEVYRRPAEVPPELNARGASCGIIALWSRRSNR